MMWRCLLILISTCYVRSDEWLDSRTMSNTPDHEEHKVAACEEDKLFLQCNNRYNKLVVGDVFYGRDNAHTCRSKVLGTQKMCHPENSNHVTKKVQMLCSGENRCKIPVSADFMANDGGKEVCPDVRKYLVVSYTCQQHPKIHQTCDGGCKNSSCWPLCEKSCCSPAPVEGKAVKTEKSVAKKASITEAISYTSSPNPNVALKPTPAAAFVQPPPQPQPAMLSASAEHPISRSSFPQEQQLQQQQQLQQLAYMMGQRPLQQQGQQRNTITQVGNPLTHQELPQMQRVMAAPVTNLQQVQQRSQQPPAPIQTPPQLPALQQAVARSSFDNAAVTTGANSCDACDSMCKPLCMPICCKTFAQYQQPAQPAQQPWQQQYAAIQQSRNKIQAPQVKPQLLSQPQQHVGAKRTGVPRPASNGKPTPQRSLDANANKRSGAVVAPKNSVATKRSETAPATGQKMQMVQNPLTRSMHYIPVFDKKAPMKFIRTSPSSAYASYYPPVAPPAGLLSCPYECQFSCQAHCPQKCCMIAPGRRKRSDQTSVQDEKRRGRYVNKRLYERGY